MRPHLPLFLLTTALSLTAACVVDSTGGSGRAATTVRPLEAVDALRFGAAWEVTVDTDAALDQVTLTCDDNLLELIDTDVVDGLLALGTVAGRSFRPRTSCSAHVELTRSPTVLEVSGAGSLVVDGRLEGLEEARVSGAGELVLVDGTRICDLLARVSGSGDLDLGELRGCALDANVSGSGTMWASGSVEIVEVVASGAGDLHLDELVTSVAEVRISGAGSVGVTVLDRLFARVSGAGDLTVYGSPTERDVSVSGAGDVRYAE